MIATNKGEIVKNRISFIAYNHHKLFMNRFVANNITKWILNLDSLAYMSILHKTSLDVTVKNRQH